ncbi:hypothetical protein BH10PSE12_BH10PSE12_18810 [soil metagenome]
MSFDKCLDTLRATGSIDPKREDQARKMYEEIRAAIGDELGGDEAAAKATQRAMERLKAEAAEKRRQTLLQASRQREIMGNLRGYRTAKGQEDWAQAATAHLDLDPDATFSNVEARRKSVLGQAHGKMTEVLATFRRDLLGRVRKDADLNDMVRASFGEKVDNASAHELAKAWTETAEHLRQRFNQAGGHVPKRKDWGLPQSHDMVAVRKAGFDDWRAFVMPRLDPNRMYDELTGRPMTPAQVERTIRSVFDTISTEGWNAVEPSGVPINGKVANRRDDPRYLAFKDADAWLEYQGKFSKGTPFDVMLDYMHGMSRDIAMMEVLGPNPGATMRWMEQMIQKRAAEQDAVNGNGKLSQKATSAVKLSRDMYAQLSGQATAPVSGPWANGMAATRSFLVSSQLGSASLSATTDLGFQKVAAKFTGLPVTGVMKNYLKLFRPTATADQKLAVRLGLIAENWSTMALAQARYTDEVAGPEISRRLADFTLRASLLSPWTQAGKWAFGMEFMGSLADNRGNGFDGLSAPLRATMKRYGISAEEWDIIRATPLYTHKRATFLRPDDLATRKDIPPGIAGDLTTRVLEMVQTEQMWAIPESTVRGRAYLLSDVRPGTVAGEALRSTAMYKGFGVSLAYMQAKRSMSAKGKMAKAGYAANLLIATTIMGALAMQLKNIAKGKDPVDMTDQHAGAFWGAAILQGGGMGIYGDFLFSDINRFGGGLGDTVAGPVVGLASDVRNLTIGNAAQIPGEGPTNAGRESINMARRYTPAIGSLWYTRLAYERILLDQLQKEVDPHYQDRFHAMEAKARKEMDQEYWWRPGEMAPSVDRP